MATKKELLGELDAMCKEGTIFASNTSSLSITEMALGLKQRAEREKRDIFAGPSGGNGRIPGPALLATSITVFSRKGKWQYSQWASRWYRVAWTPWYSRKISSLDRAIRVSAIKCAVGHSLNCFSS